VRSPAGFHDLVSGRLRGWPASLARGLLRVAEMPYTWAVLYRNGRFARGRSPVLRVPVPVVSVGNITAGGTGKTPMVAWLARWFLQRKLRVALVSRGYRAARAEGWNDEARELRQRLPDVPHLQHADRVAAARLAVERERAQVVLLDDAFQHRRIHRDLDIVLIDALQPFGFRHVLPRGLLREPLRGLGRADAVGLSRADAVSAEQRQELWRELRELAPQALPFEIAHHPAALINAQGTTRPAEVLAQQPVAAFCGIGNPDGFRHSLASLGCNVVAFRAFPDHHAFRSQDRVELEQWIARQPPVTALVCTCKDLVKFDVIQLAHRPLWALAVEIQFLSGQDQLETRLRSLVD